MPIPPLLRKIHPDFGKGGGGIAEPLSGSTLRDILQNHRDVIESLEMGGSGAFETVDQFVALPGQVNFPLSTEPVGSVEVLINGQTQTEGHDFNITGIVGSRLIFWNSADFYIASGDRVQVYYFRLP